MWPKPLDIHVDIPGLDKLLAKIDQMQAKAAELAFWKGVETGSLYGFLIGVGLTLLLLLLWQNTRRQ